MAHAMNNDLVRRRLIENQIGVGMSHDAAKLRPVRPLPHFRMPQEQRDDGLHAPLDLRGSLGRVLGDVI